MKIEPKIHTHRFLKHAAKFFLEQDFLRELMQNSVRAHADKITLTVTKNKVTLRDNGVGIPATEEAWQKLLTIGDSGWEESIEKGQDPAGMGLFASLLRFPALIESGRYAVSTEPKQIISGEATPLIELYDTVPGFSITLEGDAAKRLSNWETHPRADEWEPFSGYLYNVDQKPVHLTITVLGKTVTEGLIRDQTWAAQQFDVNKPSQLTVSREAYEQSENRVTQGTIKETVPGLTEYHPGVTLILRDVSETFAKYGKVDYSFFGMIVHPEDQTVRRAENTLVAVVIHGENPWKLEAQLPTRTHLRDTSGWKRFKEEVLLPFIKKAGKHRLEADKQKGLRPIVAIPDCGDIPTEAGYSLKQMEYQALQLLHNQGVLPPAPKPRALSLESWPEAYRTLDVYVDPGELNWCNPSCERDEDPEHDPKNSATYAHTTETSWRIAQRLAAEGQLRFGIAQKEIIPTDQIDKHGEFKTLYGAHVDTLELAPNQGNYTIHIVESLGVSAVGKSWHLKKPAILAEPAVKETDNWQYEWERSEVTFIANRAYLNLISEDPEKAYTLFIQAADDTYSYECAEDHPEYNYDTFSREALFKTAKSFFIAPTLEEPLEEFFRKFLRDNIPMFAAYGATDKTFIRKLHYEKGKAEADITVETKDEVAKGSYKGGKWVFKTHERQKRPKKQN